MSLSVRSPFSCTILSSLGTSFHPFLTLCVQPKMPEPAGSQSLAGPHVHQDSLLLSLYGQITSLIKPVWLWAPSSSASPIPCPCRFSSLELSHSLSVQGLSWGAWPQMQHLCPGPRDGGADRCQVGGGAGIACPEGVALYIGDAPCAAKE